MKRLKSLFLLICVLSITALAEIQKPATPKQPTTQDIPVTLCRQKDNKTLRAPSNNPDNVITGAYNATTGTLSIYTECDSEWVLTITSSSKSATYNVSTSALLNSTIAKTKRATFQNETSKTSLFSLPFFSYSFDCLNIN